MLLDSFLLLFLIIFSFGLFMINNLYIILGILIIALIVTCFYKVRLPLYLPFIFLLIINFIFNLYFSNMKEAFLVTLRIFLMFTIVNIIVKKIGIYKISEIIGNFFHSKDLTLIISISFSFIPIMVKEINEIRKSLQVKHFEVNLKNILTRPNIFVITFFTNLFKRVEDMEKVFIAKGIDE